MLRKLSPERGLWKCCGRWLDEKESKPLILNEYMLRIAAASCNPELEVLLLR
jgi:hypothetical protein